MEGGGSPCSSQIAFPGVEPLPYELARLGAIRALVFSACLAQIRVGAGWKKRDQVFLAMMHGHGAGRDEKFQQPALPWVKP